MSDSHFIIEKSGPISGEVALVGAKNAVLVIIASLILTEGKSKLVNVPSSQDVLYMIQLLTELGAQIYFNQDEGILDVDTSGINRCKVNHEIMKKMRASILVMGPLLARFGRADIALPGGCIIGARPINYHIANFVKMGVTIQMDGDFLYAKTTKLVSRKLVLDYPSVGATENIMMAAVLTSGVTRIINAALEPEVLDLIDVLKKMGAIITVFAPATIDVTGVTSLKPIEHKIMSDRLEAGTLLLAAAITGGTLAIPDARADHLDTFLAKLQEMGHQILVGPDDLGITIHATHTPQAVSFKTAPYPGFPTDLQAPMMAAQCLAQGQSIIEETVFENRLIHAKELQKMGASIHIEYNKAIVTGVSALQGASVTATDIRAAGALIIAGFAATGTTIMGGVHHVMRGYEGLDNKFVRLGGKIMLQSTRTVAQETQSAQIIKNYSPTPKSLE